MDLTNQYLVAWMAGASVDVAFGRLDQGVATTGLWLVGRQVKGETPGIGLWVAVGIVQRVGGPQKIESDSINAKVPTLIRWEWIMGAIADDKPVRNPAGFQVRP